MSDWPDSFFNPERTEAPISEWDGTPRLLMDYDQLCAIISIACPHWRADVTGPPAFGTFVPTRLEFGALVAPTRNLALQTIESRLRQCCRLWGREYDEDDWAVELYPVWQN